MVPVFCAGGGRSGVRDPFDLMCMRACLFTTVTLFGEKMQHISLKFTSKVTTTSITTIGGRSYLLFYYCLYYYFEVVFSLLFSILIFPYSRRRGNRGGGFKKKEKRRNMTPSWPDPLPTKKRTLSQELKTKNVSRFP